MEGRTPLKCAPPGARAVPAFRARRCTRFAWGKARRVQISDSEIRRSVMEMAVRPWRTFASSGRFDFSGLDPQFLFGSKPIRFWRSNGPPAPQSSCTSGDFVIVDALGQVPLRGIRGAGNTTLWETDVNPNTNSKGSSSWNGDCMRFLERKALEFWTFDPKAPLVLPIPALPAVLIADGYSTKEIAGQLQISFKTAACHRSRILAKLGVHNTATLVRVRFGRDWFNLDRTERWSTTGVRRQPARDRDISGRRQELAPLPGSLPEPVERAEHRAFRSCRRSRPTRR